MIFIESPAFSKFRAEQLSDEALQELQSDLIKNPETASSGVRIYLLFAYPKNVQSDLTPQQLKRLAAMVKQEVHDG